jgi:hypothetical protein
MELSNEFTVIVPGIDRETYLVLERSVQSTAGDGWQCVCDGAVFTECASGADLVKAHEPRVTCHLSSVNSRKSALDTIANRRRARLARSTPGYDW